MIDVKIAFSKATADEIAVFYANPDMANMVAVLATRGRELNIAFSVSGENGAMKDLIASIAAKLPPYIAQDEYHKVGLPACDAVRQ